MLKIKDTKDLVKELKNILNPFLKKHGAIDTTRLVKNQVEGGFVGYIEIHIEDINCSGYNFNDIEKYSHSVVSFNHLIKKEILTPLFNLFDEWILVKYDDYSWYGGGKQTDIRQFSLKLELFNRE